MALFFILSTLAMLASCTEAQVDQCRNFTVAKCRPDDIIGDPIPLPPSQEAFHICQEICLIAENSGCNFFRYNSLFGECTIHSSRFTASCEVQSGLSSPLIKDCIENIGPDFQTCDHFTDEDCTFDGVHRAYIPIASSAKDCQELLALTGWEAYQADYFVFDELAGVGKMCEFLKGSERRCTGMSGPIKPSMEDCNLVRQRADKIRDP